MDSMLSATTTTSPPRRSNNYRSSVEVCQGPDCFGAGGGAALLALEDWLRLDDSAIVIGGGCRNRCSMGPNVYISSIIGTDKTRQQQNSTKVTSLAECRAVLRRCGGGPSLCLDDTTPAVPTNIPPVLAKLRQRQADQQHWQALRLLARIRKSPVRVASHQIAAAREAITACPNEQQRLTNLFDRILLENEQLSDDDVDDEQSDLCETSPSNLNEV